MESWRRVAAILRGDEDLRRTSADAGRKEGRKGGKKESEDLQWTFPSIRLDS